MRVGIIGGGLAGLVAGCELAERGHAVSVLERRPWAGGATYSYLDEETGSWVDNGQHVFMRCTTAYQAFLERLGTLHLTRRQRHLRVPVFDAAGRRSDLTAMNLPFGLHLAPGFLRYRHLSWRQKLQVVRVLLAVRRLSPDTMRRLGEITFTAWLEEHDQTAETIRDFWDFLVIPTLNCRSHQASASQALFVLEEGFLKNPTSAAIGLPGVGLSELHVEPAVRYIEDRGGKLSPRAAVERIEIDDGGVVGLRLRNGERRTFDAYICALPPWRLLPLLPESARQRALGALAQFEPAPILNLHLWFDRPVASFAFAAFLHSEIQWVFNESSLGKGRNGAGPKDQAGEQHLVLSISAPGELFALDKEALRARLLPQLRAALPAARAAELVRYLAVKEPEATFVPAPGLTRPGPRTPFANLFLAGAYTDTGWPATMESAVRSGLAAAAAADAAGDGSA